VSAPARLLRSGRHGGLPLHFHHLVPAALDGKTISSEIEYELRTKFGSMKFLNWDVAITCWVRTVAG
jgi:hypothetical protein